LLRGQESAELLLPYRDEEFRVTVDRAAVLGVAAGFYRAVTQLVAQNREPGSLVVLLSDRLAALPGFIDELARIDDAQVECLAAGHAARGVLVPTPIAVTGEQVKLLKRLPWRETAVRVEAAGGAASKVAPPVVKVAPPTHIVYGGIAYPVGAVGLVIGREVDAARRMLVVEDGNSGVSRAHCEFVMRDGELKLRDLSRYGTFVNEKKISGETMLQRGDVIRVGSPGVELQAVSLEAAE